MKPLKELQRYASHCWPRAWTLLELKRGDIFHDISHVCSHAGGVTVCSPIPSRLKYFNDCVIAVKRDPRQSCSRHSELKSFELSADFYIECLDWVNIFYSRKISKRDFVVILVTKRSLLIP